MGERVKLLEEAIERIISAVDSVICAFPDDGTHISQTELTRAQINLQHARAALREGR